MKRKPTRKRPDTASAVRAQTRAIRKLAEQVHALRLTAFSADYVAQGLKADLDALRLDVQSMRIAQARHYAAPNALPAPIDQYSGSETPMVPVSPWDEPCAVMRNLQDER